MMCACADGRMCKYADVRLIKYADVRIANDHLRKMHFGVAK